MNDNKNSFHAQTEARIDVHHHILPPVYVDALKRIGQDKSGGAPLPPWSETEMLAMMDRQNIAASVISISAPGVYFGNEKFARDLARQCNEYAADLVRRHPKRLAALALLPLPDAKGALAELEYALDTLKMDGVILMASVGNYYLGDPRFDAVFDALNRRKMPVLLHSNTPPGSDVPKWKMPAFVVDFVFDTTRAVANLIYSGTLERCPDISMILSHAGGAVPYLAERLALPASMNPEMAKKAPQGALAHLRRLYYDTAIASERTTFGALIALVPPTQILFGSDTPYIPEPLVARTAQNVSTEFASDPNTRELVLKETALRLFPRLRP